MFKILEDHRQRTPMPRTARILAEVWESDL